MNTPDLNIKGLAQWFGSNRLNAEKPAHYMGDRRWVGVLFMGSACEVPYFRAPSIVCNDAHPDIINLARVTADPVLGMKLYRAVRRIPFHPEALRVAQERLRDRRDAGDSLFGGTPRKAASLDTPDLERAVDYFATVWMSRAGAAGTDGELSSSLCVRMDGGGGDPVKRYHSAASDLVRWREILRRVAFTTGDWRKMAATMIARCHKAQDESRSPAGAVELKLGVYADPPFVDVGDGYAFKFSERDHRDLCTQLGALAIMGVRVVVRYYAHPLIDELYSQLPQLWRRVEFAGRDQANQGDKPEVLFVGGPGEEIKGAA